MNVTADPTWAVAPPQTTELLQLRDGEKKVRRKAEGSLSIGDQAKGKQGLHESGIQWKSRASSDAC